MARLQRQRFQDSADVRRFPNGRVEVVELNDRAVGRMTYDPGWRWATDVKPLAGTDSCQFHHVGLTLSGRLRVQMTDGTELEVGPGDVFEFPPGHDAWVVGDEPWVSVDFEAVRRYGRSIDTTGARTLASILFTDIVDSTSEAVRLGPRAWADLVKEHNALSERVIDGYRGRLVKTTGDGAIGLFDSAERALRAGAELGRRLEPVGIRVRAGVHTGEVEVVEGDVRGIAVHAAARIMSLAGPGEVWLSATVMELAADADLTFDDAGEHELKGIPGVRRLYRLVGSSIV
ncbi:MAG TPA: adenylate/guanylate cyclase domain-containing protein [Candidatus Limnocylindrales bacterium]|nr:adenylate/guanylate cyclase domain-containing protein [Candidatus Limnocylindrales bacterium]